MGENTFPSSRYKKKYPFVFPLDTQKTFNFLVWFFPFKHFHRPNPQNFGKTNGLSAIFIWFFSPFF